MKKAGRLPCQPFFVSIRSYKVASILYDSNPNDSTPVFKHANKTTLNIYTASNNNCPHSISSKIFVLLDTASGHSKKVNYVLIHNQSRKIGIKGMSAAGIG